MWLACESAGKKARVDVSTAPRQGCGFFILDSLIVETQKSSHWNEKRRHCLGPWPL